VVSLFSEMASPLRKFSVRAVLLTFLLNDLISDLSIIGVRLQQAKSQPRIP
jgi:hypothetical protein